MAQADQRGPEGQSGDEGAGAVDRVKDPHELRVRAILAVFLANHAVVREAGGNGRPDGGLGPLVGLCHRIEDPTGDGPLVRQAMVGPEQG